MRKAITATAPMLGHRKFRLRLSNDVLRQASRGPTAPLATSNTPAAAKGPKPATS